MRLYLLDKLTLRFANNAAKFLNGLTTNTLDSPRNAFVTVHGRIVATFDQLKIADDEFCVIIEKPFYEALTQHVDKFLKLNKTKMEVAAKNLYFDLSGDAPVEGKDFVIPQKSGRLLVTARHWAVNVSDEEFTLFRLRHNIPIHGVDYHDEMILNVADEEFVSYAKGCFLGQEPIAKVHNRSKPTWKLAARFEDELAGEEKAKMTSKVKDPVTGKVMGFVFVRNS